MIISIRVYTLKKSVAVVEHTIFSIRLVWYFGENSTLLIIQIVAKVSNFCIWVENTIPWSPNDHPVCD